MHETTSFSLLVARCSEVLPKEEEKGRRESEMLRWLLLLILLMPALPARAAESTFSMRYEGRWRDVMIHQPDSTPRAAKSSRWPTVIALHGGGGRAEGMVSRYHLNETADRAGMMVVYPEGTGGFADRFRTWNAGMCCGYAMKHHVDDVGYIAALIDRLVRDYHADPKRIYVTGHSNGAQMAYRLACEIPDKIAAIAPVGGDPYRPCLDPHRHPVSILHIHGTLDRCVPFHGGRFCGGCFGDVFFGRSGQSPESRTDLWQCPSIPEALGGIAHTYGCSEEMKTTYTEGPLSCRTWQGCPARTEVTLCTVEGNGHAWPGEEDPSFCKNWPRSRLCQRWKEAVGPKVNVDINSLIFDFFQRH